MYRGLVQCWVRVASFAGRATFLSPWDGAMPTTVSPDFTHTEDKRSAKSRAHFEGTTLAGYECYYYLSLRQVVLKMAPGYIYVDTGSRDQIARKGHGRSF
jgi:hypothetical protein